VLSFTYAISQTAVVKEDLMQKVIEFVNMINDMIDQLAILADEVKNVTHEVGAEGKLDIQGMVGNVQGIWQEITYAHSYMSLSILNRVLTIRYSQITWLEIRRFN
jgi:osomolarity two-component system, sensor histidine kinase NIK1